MSNTDSRPPSGSAHAHSFSLVISSPSGQALNVPPPPPPEEDDAPLPPPRDSSDSKLSEAGAARHRPRPIVTQREDADGNARFTYEVAGNSPDIDYQDLALNATLKPDGTISDSESETEDEDDDAKDEEARAKAEAADAVPDIPDAGEVDVSGFRRQPSAPLSPASMMRKHRRQQSMSRLTDKDKRRVHRERLQRELIETEKTYVQNLDTAIEHYVKPLIKLAEEGAIKTADVTALVSNIEIIASFHRKFLPELSKPDNFNVNGVAMCFLQFSDYLKLYTAYVTGYYNGINIFNALSANKKVNQLLQTAMTEHHLMDLMSYLILPIQRIPRYEMLLTALKKYSEPDPVHLVPPALAAARLAAPSSPGISPQGKLLRRSSVQEDGGPDEASLAARLRDNVSLTPVAPSASSEKGRRPSVLEMAEGAGPLARLELALSRIKDIAVYINEHRREDEVLRFNVVKINQFNANTRRVFELDAAKKCLTVLKSKSDAPSSYVPDFHIQSESMIGIKLSNKSQCKITMWFFQSENRLLRAQKEWKILFRNSGERERFYRLAQVHLIRPVKGESYVPKPLKVTPQVEDQLTDLPVKELAAGIHDSWIQQRLEKGWKHGPALDETKKTHPLLVGFSELQQHDQDQVSSIARETIAAIITLGFQITKSRKPPKPPGVPLSPTGEAPVLDTSIVQLVEYLAENAHDSWAENKLKEGWTFGEKLDLTSKKHPNLVPYYDMPSYEQDYDRASAVKVINTLMDLGFSITKDSRPDNSDWVD